MTSRQEPPPTDPRALQQDPVRLCAEADSHRDPSAAWGLSLLREAAPYQTPAGRKERVWLALPPVRSYRPARLRFALAAIALLVSGIMASAALAQWPAWLAGVLDRMGPSSAPPAPTTRPAQKAPAERPAEPLLAPLPAPAPAAPSLPSPVEETPARPKRATKPASPDNMGPLLEAMRALRVEHNALRARGLLTNYLDRHPKDALSEEALVMLIEAAAAHDDSDAPALAARYLTLYPHGPFRGMVERMLAATKKGP